MKSIYAVPGTSLFRLSIDLLTDSGDSENTRINYKVINKQVNTIKVISLLDLIYNNKLYRLKKLSYSECNLKISRRARIE